MSPWVAVELAVAAVLVLLGITVAAAGGLVSGVLVALAGVALFSRTYRRL